jgi:MipA family protein
MPRAIHGILPACLGLLAALACGSAAAQPVMAPPEPASLRPNFEGAIGLQLNNSPEYQGSSLRKTALIPGLYLRWGRLSIATAGNFVTRYDDEVVRGLGAELIRRDDLRVQLGLRWDPGRKTSASVDLDQLDPVRPTVRARLTAVWHPVPHWSVGAGWSNDLLARGGGGLVDVGVGREFRLGPHTALTLSSGLTWGNERYMQGRFGISPDAAARTGKPVYAPASGWRDVSLSAQVRSDLDKRWSVWGGGSVSRLLGPAIDSPLTKQTTQAVAGAGFAWRF